jgi:UDP-N-acetylmuramate--alanine ligase
LIGICGTAMATLAAMLKQTGFNVRGSDQDVYPPMSDFLHAEGIPTFVGYRPEHISADLDLVIVGNAISRGNPELEEVLDRKIRYCSLPEAIREHFLWGARSIVIAGTHGKTTTTSMTAHVLKSLGENPTALVGGELNDIGSNVAFGRTDLVVAEADESDRSLLQLRPRAAVVTNVEFDHPDFYASLDDVLETFSAFVGSLPPDGHLVTCAEDPSCPRLVADAPCPATTYGISAGDLRAKLLSPNSYVLTEDGERRGTVELGVYGRHNVLNSLAAAGIARWLGHDAYKAACTLKDFGGVRRRFQLKGEQAEVKVVDDYAHHPTELSATLEAARVTMPPGGRVIAVFQPHRFSRTRKLYREFGGAFAAADAVLVTEVYGAGEMPQPGINGKLIVDAICETRGHPDVYYIPQQDAIPKVLREISERGDVVLTLGAGDISSAGEELLELLGTSRP